MKVPLDALILEANYETRLTMEVARLLNIPTPKLMREMCPEAYKHYEHMQEIYRKIDDTGYENISPEVYDRWLKHIEQEKEKEKRHPRSPVHTDYKINCKSRAETTDFFRPIMPRCSIYSNEIKVLNSII